MTANPQTPFRHSIYQIHNILTPYTAIYEFLVVEKHRINVDFVEDKKINFDY